MTIRVLIVDDHPVVRSGLKSLLDAEDDIDVVGEAANMQDAIFRTRSLKPDVILMDVVMPGASGIEATPAVLKEAADEEVVSAVREVAAGGRYVHPALGAKLVAADAEERARAEADPLTEREREVLRLLALGHTNQEIAKTLFLSVRTVETHRAHIMQKLRLSTRAELVRHAMEQGLLEEPAGG